MTMSTSTSPRLSLEIFSFVVGIVTDPVEECNPAIRLASVEVLASEQKTKAVGVLPPAIGWVSQTMPPLTAQGIGEQQPVRHWL